MPSQARVIARDKLIPEVANLMKAHAKLRKGAKGPDTVNAILRTSVIMLSAIWEQYCESLVCESAKKIISQCSNPNTLPEAVKRLSTNAIHNENEHMSRAFLLAGDGWKTIYVDAVKAKTDNFNSPKSEPVEKLFQQCLGLKKVSKNWRLEHSEINKMISLRGAIAHNGSDSRRVRREEVTHFKSVVQKTILDTDNAVYDYLKNSNFYGRAPWQKTS